MLSVASYINVSEEQSRIMKKDGVYVLIRLHNAIALFYKSFYSETVRLLLTTHLYGRYSHQVGIRLGQRLGQLQVQHTAGHRPHPPQGASPLFVASPR